MTAPVGTLARFSFMTLAAGVTVSGFVLAALAGNEPGPVAFPGSGLVAAAPAAGVVLPEGPVVDRTVEPSSAPEVDPGSTLQGRTPPEDRAAPAPAQLVGSLPDFAAPTEVNPVAAAPGPATGQPRYSASAVLSMAAVARLPSGRTFQECVEAAPGGQRWPAPVHLYSRPGQWVVETRRRDRGDLRRGDRGIPHRGLRTAPAWLLMVQRPCGRRGLRSCIGAVQDLAPRA